MNNSILQTESLSIYEAVKWCTNNNLDVGQIFTESNSSIQSLQQLKPTSLRARYIKWYIIEHPGLKIIISLLKSHSGIIGNEKADNLAKYLFINDIKQCDNTILHTFIILKKNYFSKNILTKI